MEATITEWDTATKVAAVGVVVAIVGVTAAVLAALYAYPAYRTSKAQRARDRFVETRESLQTRRQHLTTQALSTHSRAQTSDLPGMLSCTRWIPRAPLPLQQVVVRLELAPRMGYATPKVLAQAKKMLPRGSSGKDLEKYTEAMDLYARPKLFDNRVCYRLLDAKLDGDDTSLLVGLNYYFDSLNESEAVAHEYAHASLRSGSRFPSKTPVRSRIGNPLQLARRNAIFSISALTIRADRKAPTFFLHSREHGSVAVAGNLLHLAPSGVFQPAADDNATIGRDLSPWLTLCREYAEEYLGVEEAQGNVGVALSYDEDQPYSSINAAYQAGMLKISVLGLGLDPLTLCPELVTVAIVEPETFDDLFENLTLRNNEGFMRGAKVSGGKLTGFPFDAQTINGFLERGNLAPAARAALVRGRAFRDMLME
ncbi:hypothetical protein GR927_28375 [Mycolicibacterium sp. 3033]|nr:hypothetical protein [Mycolicibacterium aurantiacum]